MARDRVSALLSKNNRRWFDSDDDYEPADVDKFLSDMRHRIRVGIADCNPLWRGSTADDREHIFRDKSTYEVDEFAGFTKEDPKPGHIWEVRNGIESFISFAYLGLKEQGEGPGEFEQLLTRSIEAAERKFHESERYDIQVDMDVELTDNISLDSAMRKYENHGIDKLHPVELKALVENGRLQVSEG